MNSKTKVLLSSIGLVLLIALAVLLYNLFGTEDTATEEITTEEITTEDSVDNSSASLQNNLILDFSVMDDTGNMVKLSDYLGKPIVVNFWASWCPPCKNEMPHFNKVYGELKDNVVFIMVNLTDGKRETAESAKAFIQGKKYTFPVYYDTKGEASSLYKVDVIPQTLFFDKNGTLINSITGGITEKTLRQNINKIINN